MDKCFIAACKRPTAQRTRGLCMVCYKAAKAKVDNGEVSWERLADLLLCKPSEGNPFDEAYKKAVDEEDSNDIPF